MPSPQIINESDVEAKEKAPDGKRGFQHQRLSQAVGGEMLGCSLYTLAPDAESWPYHYHTANEEAIYVLNGRGTVRLAGEQTEIREGDYVTLPKAEAGAHRISNSGDGELRYLCVSTMVEPDVVVYPDSNMIGVFAGAPPGGNQDDGTIQRYLRADAEVDYWTGER